MFKILNLKKNHLTIILSFILLVVIFFIYEICEKPIFNGTGDRATWISTLLSFLSLIITGGIGYYAYQVATNQNASSETTYMIEILKCLADDANKYQEKAKYHDENQDNGKMYDNTLEMISKIIKAKKMILKINVNKKDLYYDIFYSFISTLVIQEVKEQCIYRKIINHIDNTEINILMNKYKECYDLVNRYEI